MTLRLSDDFDSDLDVCTVFVCWSLGTDYITYTAFLLLPSSQKATSPVPYPQFPLVQNIIPTKRSQMKNLMTLRAATPLH